jgi:hypothetical protein
MRRRRDIPCKTPIVLIKRAAAPLVPKVRRTYKSASYVGSFQALPVVTEAVEKVAVNINES